MNCGAAAISCKLQTQGWDKQAARIQAFQEVLMYERIFGVLCSRPLSFLPMSPVVPLCGIFLPFALRLVCWLSAVFRMSSLPVYVEDFGQSCYA